MKQINDIYDRANKTVIVPSTTWLYYRQDKKNDPKVTAVYYPYNINLSEELKVLRDALMGDEVAKKSMIYEAALVRFGWLDKDLGNLRWIPLSTLVDSYIDSTISKSHRIKLSHICRLLFLSIREIK